MTGQQIGRPSFDHPSQMGRGKGVARAQRTGNACSTSPMALRRTIKIRGAEAVMRRIVAQRPARPKGSFFREA